MKYLEIKDNQGYYWDGNTYQEIDKINKEGLLVLLNAAEQTDFQLDPYNETLLANKAHQVIYQNIYSKFEQFLNDKNQFKTEVDSLYKEAISKYGIDENADSNDKLDQPENEEVDGEYINPEDIPF